MTLLLYDKLIDTWRSTAKANRAEPQAHVSFCEARLAMKNAYGGPRSVSVKHVWKNVARRRTENSTKIFWVRAGLFVGCRESLQSLWGELF
jgi:hypothetical protein